MDGVSLPRISRYEYRKEKRHFGISLVILLGVVQLNVFRQRSIAQAGNRWGWVGENRENGEGNARYSSCAGRHDVQRFVASRRYVLLLRPTFDVDGCFYFDRGLLLRDVFDRVDWQGGASGVEEVMDCRTFCCASAKPSAKT